MAQRLRACVREADTVARQGGDEFVILLEGLGAEPLVASREVDRVGQKLLAVFQTPFALEGGDFHCTASIGVTLFGDKSEPADEPLKRADLAMYQAKAAGRNVLRFFDPASQALVAARVALEERLRLAVGNQAFELHFQPLVARSGQIAGAEALIRWTDPQRGVVSPADFIPLAEETGLIVPIGRWVLDEAARTLAAWATVPALANLTLSVNVSTRQFQQADFIEDVLEVLTRHNVPPSRLKLELTESVLVDRFDEVIAKMDALRGHGVRFSLDDFGTGYSSLSYLKRLPIEELKIDRSFVRDVLVDANDAAIAEMVLALARTLRLGVVAEGVETEPQRRFLDDRGCAVFQGYLFSRPLPAAAFAAWVQGYAAN